MRYLVSYASVGCVGCLPDNEPIEFETLREAANYIFHERQDRRAELIGADIHTYGKSREDIRDDMGADDPAPGSLYRWTIEEVN